MNIRKDFQKYMKEKPYPWLDVTRRKLLGPKAVKLHWDTWQAAVKSVVVTPPATCYFEGADVEDFFRHMQTLGLSVVHDPRYADGHDE